MPKLAANLSMLFNEVPFLERFAAAARAGFTGVEFLFPYDHAPEDLAEALRDNGLEQALFNLPPGDWEAGERGLAALPGREAEFQAGLERALPYALALDCRRVHMMAGIPPEGADRPACRDAYVASLRAAAAFFAPHGVSVLVEPINARDIPGYFLNHQGQAVALIEAAGAPNTGLQMDFYHCQIVDGDLATHLRANFRHIRHLQIAGVPERHEPDRGEVNYPYLFDLLDELGYDGWIGCEYRPAGDTLAGLVWARAYGIAPTRP
ncbi:MAG: hydroxypyruvate isomerase family protein [Proteobacteria bacterium]|nr:hydroxypyruvate isomerase family protein [Pseudomonadota bacterium]